MGDAGAYCRRPAVALREHAGHLVRASRATTDPRLKTPRWRQPRIISPPATPDDHGLPTANAGGAVEPRGVVRRAEPARLP